MCTRRSPPARSDASLPDPPPPFRAQVKGFVPREEWLPFSEPELQVLATVRRWLGAARFDAVPLSTRLALSEERLFTPLSL